MKKILIFTGVMAISDMTYANIDGNYAIINDPDGYTNVHQRDNLSSSVITKLSNKTPVSAMCDDTSLNKNFCMIRFGKNQDGFIYKNRLSFLTPNATFTKIPLANISSDKTEGKFGNKGVTVNIKFVPIKINIKQFNAQTSNKFGINPNDPIADYYQLKNIQVDIGDKVINLPNSASQDIFLNHYFLTHDEISNNMSVYQNKKDNHLYIIGRFTDGALMYSVIYEIKDGKYVRRNVWSESI